MASSLLQTGQDLFQFYLPVYAHGAGLSASAISRGLGDGANAAEIQSAFDAMRAAVDNANTVLCKG